MRKRKFLRNFKIYWLIISMVMVFSLLIRELSSPEELFPEIETLVGMGKFRFLFPITLFISIGLSVLSSLIDLFILPKIIGKKSLAVALAIGLLVQGWALYAIIIVVLRMVQAILYHLTGTVVELSILAPNILPLAVSLAFALLLSRVFIEIDKKLGPGNLWKMIHGRFYRPREVERIFLFVDLQDSTPLAEKLGNLNFSGLIKDCFDDFAIVDDYQAEIYQYVGDEAVICWSVDKGLKGENFLAGFFAFDALLKSKSAYYEKTYGVRPFFKAGANLGSVVVTEVGDIKREITYHGDTLNTAARIQGMCNELNAQLLIPEHLYEKVKNVTEYQFEDVGCTSLKGIEKEVRLYRVSLTDPAEKLP